MSGLGHLGEIRTIDYFEKQLGMEIYLPLKDKGIDFIGIKGDRVVHIQVKTSMQRKRADFWFTLKRSSLRFRKSVFYVFVCHTMPRRRFMGKSRNVFVVPSATLRKWIDGKEILPAKKDKGIFHISLYADEKSKTWTYRDKGRELDWTPYWNEESVLFK